MVSDKQLYKELKFLCDKIGGWHQLTDEEKNDAFSDAFVAIHKKMKDNVIPSDTYENYKMYMFITLKNHILIRFKKRKKVRKIDFEDLPETTDIDAFSPVFQETFKENAIQPILALIQQLRPREREVLELFIEGYTPEQISKKLGLQITNTYTLLCLARKYIKKNYKYD